MSAPRNCLRTMRERGLSKSLCTIDNGSLSIVAVAHGASVRRGWQHKLHSASQAPPIAGELVVVRAAGEAPLPRRRDGQASDRVEQLTKLLAALIGKDAAIDKLAFRKSLEAPAPASVKALANDLACYAPFARAGGIGRPANEARVVAYLEDCERRELKPATVGRRLASLAVVNGLLGAAMSRSVRPGRCVLVPASAVHLPRNLR